jgi:chromate transporter
MDEPSAHSASAPPIDQVPQVSLATIFWIFFQIGSLSVGGGLTAWLYREVVEKRRLMPEADFMGALTLAQVLPGINMSNLSVYVGQRLRGVQGALVAMLGLTIVPFFAIIFIGSIYSRFQAEPSVHHVMDGLAATAVALLLAMGIKAIKVTRMQPLPLGLAVLVVVLVGILRLPMVPVILVLAPLSVWLAWREIEKERANAPGKDEPDA